MNCWHCKTALVWGSDATDADDESRIVTFLSCPNCPTYVEVYYHTNTPLNPIEEEEEKAESPPPPTLVVPVRTN